MPGFLDKVKQAAGGVADATKKGAAAAQTKAKVHSLRGKADDAAKQLGYLVHAERTGLDTSTGNADELVGQITELEKQIAELQAEPEGEGEEEEAPS